ncbi:MAG: type II toxin-antitoxin system PemK/MazF family toxin [Microthrixaceae bacterium]
MSRFTKIAKLAGEFVEYMAKPQKKSGSGKPAPRAEESPTTKSGSAPASGSRPRLKPSAPAKGRTAAPAKRSTPKPTPTPKPAKATDTSGPLEVSYEPDLDGDPDPGEVVWTYVSYEDDPSQGKDRPVAVIGWDGPVLGVVQLTSRDKDRSDHVPIGTGAWDRERRPSFAKIDRILRVQPDEVRREGAVLAEDRFTHLVKELRAMHGWPLDTNDDA